jgi:6-phospho-beta-glucosidase
VKLAIIGGAGVRVPLLVGGFARSTLRVDRVDLYDVDGTRLAIVADLARRMAPDLPVHAHAAPEPCVEGADFVITSIRVGGIAQRARDEATCIAHDVVGQETVGPAGFAMAVRTIPSMIEYGRLVARLAPSAWLVNFTNPVSIISQALHQHTEVRSIGICDTPAEIFEDAAHALGLPPAACDYDYFGLNHLGWLREVTFRGEPQMARLWDDDGRLEAAYRSPLFEHERLRALRLLPTEYLYYYYRPEVALANLRKARTSRGVVVSALTDTLFADLARGAGDPIARYQQYVAARDGSYMQLESGSAAPRIKPDWAELSGYDKIALTTISAIAGNTGAVIPLNVPNRTVLPFLDDDDIIETPCAVGTDGPLARPVAPVPDHARDLIMTVKDYERATVHAALTRDRNDLAAALALNPLVPSREQAAVLVDALLPA